ncbi:hypothetical protein BGW80DRAFT_1566319 [Lactifluus volemus]|nr:hypothetical protein BGW80DRAFT_1566319 [Lactifluus volemus]
MSVVDMENDPEHPDFGDSAEPLFFMYQKMTEVEDNERAEHWQKDTKGIIIFTGLFSATVAVLVAVSIPDLKPNPQDTSAFYLQKMYELQVLAGSNMSLPSTPAIPPPFSAPKYAIWVNSLWFLSLTISITCAMLATLMQQWARRFLRVTQPPQLSPSGRARIRAFYSGGVEKFHLSSAVEVLPTLIHLSLFLFFAGLLVYLFNVHHFVFLAIVWWVGVSSLAYLAITFMPAWWHECPYYTPITSIIGLLRHIEGETKESIPRKASGVDGDILKWTFKTLADDHDLEKFFEKIPGFCNPRSSVVQNAQVTQHLTKIGSTLSSSLIGFLFRTSSSNSLSKDDKKRRFIISVKAAEVMVKVASLPGPIWHIFETTFCGKWKLMLQSVTMADSLKGTDHGPSLFLQSLTSGLIANVRASDRNDHWVALAAHQLHQPEDTIRDYRVDGDGWVLLANLTHITHQIVDTLDMANLECPVAKAASEHMLPSLSKFDIPNVPQAKLQEDFVGLWDMINLRAQNELNKNLKDILSKICDDLRHLYTALSMKQGVRGQVGRGAEGEGEIGEGEIGEGEIGEGEIGEGEIGEGEIGEGEICEHVATVDC